MQCFASPLHLVQTICNADAYLVQVILTNFSAFYHLKNPHLTPFDIKNTLLFVDVISSIETGLRNYVHVHKI